MSRETNTENLINTQLIMNTLFTFVKRTYVYLLMCAVLVIVAMPLSAQNISSGTANQQITGLVTDDKGEPLIGANVVLKGSSAVGVITDLDGKFSLNAPLQGTLQISYIGYHAQEVSINGKNHFTVQLQEDSNTLDDVIVVGYGVMKKSDVISSVTTIKTDKMTKAATLDIGEMLRGRAAGLKITTSENAGPGGSSNIQIRGTNSISGGTTPIVVADGVVIGSINDVNPNDIASVEIQIMADSHGNVVALGERDCSVQRNHQKLIEESPSPAIDEETRRKMNEYAVLAAKTVGYTNAGTIEFIVDPKGNFYFMEMNTRIQVEHGVTEMVTGTDLIIEQIRVAMGEELSFKQEDIRIKGHAIECRINAEIPEKNFMPSPGVVQHMHLPAGNGVRVDTALYTGYKIPSEYDSMIAKVIVHAPDREAALQKMRSALDEMVVMGVETNLDFQYQIMKNQVFCDGKADTGFIENVLKIKG